MDLYGLSTPGCLRNMTAWQKMVTGRPLLCCYQYKSPLQVSSSGVSGSWTPVGDDDRCSKFYVKTSPSLQDQREQYQRSRRRHKLQKVLLSMLRLGNEMDKAHRWCTFYVCSLHVLYLFLHKPQSSQVGTGHCRT